MTRPSSPNPLIGNRLLSHFPLALWVLGLGVWTLGLARYLAEALHIALLFSSPLAVGGLALAGMGLALALWWILPSSLRPRLACWGGALLLPLLYVLASRPSPLMGLTLLGGGVGLALLLGLRAAEGNTYIQPLLLTLFTLSLYLLTLGRTVGQADTFEFQVVAPTLGIAHPTGYPLYIMLGKLFSLLPLGSVAWRVNLTSALSAVGAVVCCYLLLERLTQARGVSFLAALALAFSRPLWSQAVIAEVYGLNLLFVAGVLLLGGILLEKGGDRRTVWGFALLLGLSLTHHLTMLLLLPAVGGILLLSRPRLTWRGWLGAVALFLLGLMAYAYIPLRWPALHDGQGMGLGPFLAYVTGQQFGGALQWGLLRDPTRYGILGRLLLEPFGWIGAALAASGLVWLALRRRRMALVTVLAFLPYCLYGLVYRVPDISVFLLPAHLLLALWIGVGVAALIQGARRFSLWAPCLLIPLFALLPLSQIWLNLPVVDQSDRVETEQWGRYVLSLPLARGSAVLADGEKFASLYYLQQIEGVRPDLDLVVHFAEETYRADLQARMEVGQTVYLARYLPHLEGFFLRSVGPLVEVGSTPQRTLPPGMTPAEVPFGPAVDLRAFDLQPDPQGRPLRHLTLYWQASAPPEEDLEVRLRLVDPAGEVAWASDGVRPVGGNYPTNGWSVGAIVPDYHPLSLPPWLPEGEYELQVALFPRFSSHGLLVDGGDEVWWPLAEVTQEQPQEGAADLPFRYHALLSSAWLVGYDAPDTVPAGSPAVVDLAWVGGEEECTVVFLVWIDEEGRWVPGSRGLVRPETVRSRLSPVAPDRPGRYRLGLITYGEGFCRNPVPAGRYGVAPCPVRCRWLAPPASACDLAVVQVEPAQEGLATFGGRILLLAAEVGTEQLSPGGSLPVTLRWRAQRSMAEDYTVTVQLLGPDGRLYGQVDGWPVQGTLPTSQWASGQEVTDPYQVPLASDAPPGRYRVVVGWYLLATMERLPVVDAAGTPIADHVVVGEVTVSGGGE